MMLGTFRGGVALAVLLAATAAVPRLIESAG
jgi:hypothetical protein